MSSNRQRGEKVMLIGTDVFLNYSPPPPTIYKIAQEEIFRYQPRIMAGLLPYSESVDATQYIIHCETPDYGMVFMFHCFNILLENGELPE